MEERSRVDIEATEKDKENKNSNTYSLTTATEHAPWQVVLSVQCPFGPQSRILAQEACSFSITNEEYTNPTLFVLPDH